MTNAEGKVVFLLNWLKQIQDNLKTTHMTLNERIEFEDIIKWMIRVGEK